MGTGGGAYSWHTYSTASNALGAAKFFPFFLSGFYKNCSASLPHRRCKTQESRQHNAALWNSQVVSISSNISVSKFHGLRLVRTCQIVYNIFRLLHYLYRSA